MSVAFIAYQMLAPVCANGWTLVTRGTHVQLIGYSPPLTNLATQTEFSQPQKDCSGSSKNGHGLKFERWIVELI